MSEEKEEGNSEVIDDDEDEDEDEDVDVRTYLVS